MRIACTCERLLLEGTNLFLVSMLEEIGKELKFERERCIWHTRKLFLAVKSNEELENSGVSILGHLQKQVR